MLNAWLKGWGRKLVLVVLLLLALSVFLFCIIGWFRGDYPFSAIYHLLLPVEVNISETDIPHVSPTSPVLWKGNLENPDLDELSGLASSSRYPQWLYGINDSGGEAVIFIMDQTGRHLGEIPVNLDKPRDWEDMASFHTEEGSYLLLADTGDNLRWRGESQIHIIDEPNLNMDSLPALKIIRPVDVLSTIRFRFAEGPRDCESVAVDHLGNIFLLSKRTAVPELYLLEIKIQEALSDLKKDHIYEARLLTLLKGIPGPTKTDIREDPEYGEYRSMPTALSISGNRAMVVTYGDAYLYELTEHTGSHGWEVSFAGNPRRIPLPPVKGREAGTLSFDGQSLFVSGERYEGRGAQAIYQVILDP